MPTPSFREDHTSQIPALQFLCALGWQYLTPAEALAERGNRTSSVLLEDILRERLRAINTIRYRGKEYPFFDMNIEAAIRILKDVPYDVNFMQSSEELYNLLTQGRSFEQTVGGDKKSFTLKYIDWENPENNVYYVTAEYKVLRSGSSTEYYEPDIVLFVNGIPLVIIECKSPALKDAETQAISQHLRSQQADGIPALYVYSQLLLSLAGHEAKYGTTVTPEEFWSVWKERFASEKDREKFKTQVQELKNTVPNAEQQAHLFQPPFAGARSHFEQLWQEECTVTAQDKLLYSLCSPARLLELIFGFILYEQGEKKLCRYQQYFVVRKTIRRIEKLNEKNRRRGGVVWHSQGSGKSLTMVYLAQHIAMSRSIKNPQIVLVTDRIDLDDQIKETFQKCGKDVHQATTGRDLLAQLHRPTGDVITTVINKFGNAVKNSSDVFESTDIFILVDEGHRTQYGSLATKMRRMFPNGCFIGFTGTPLTKKQKHTARIFGGFIDKYTITQAEEDGAVVPLLYEGRYVQQEVQERPLDAAFDRIAESMPEYQANEFKHKASSRRELNKAEQRIEEIAHDISKHFTDTWKNTGYKGQLVTPDKKTALRYKKALDELGKVTSEVLISPPDEREGHIGIDSETDDEVQKFWKKMMQRHHSPKKYADDIIKWFKSSGDPDIVIVVDKLLTGFDAPRNVVLYIAKPLKEHTLLQAIARVNRVFPGKEYGYIIDYEGVLGKLDEAMKMYSGLDEFDAEDVEGTLQEVRKEIEKLPQLHSGVWEVFQSIRNKQDTEAYAELLRDLEQRETFYERLRNFLRCWCIALSSNSFTEMVSAETAERYEKDAGFFLRLRDHVRQRYSDELRFADYEPQIRKLIDRHVAAYNTTSITGLVNIFNKEEFEAEVRQVTGTAAKADTITSRTSRYVTENMEKDPYFYKKLSELIKQTIEDYRQGRIDEAEYLKKAREQQEAALNRTDSSIPEVLRERGAAQAFYGVMLETLSEKVGEKTQCRDICTQAAIGIDDVLLKHIMDGGRPIVDWQSNTSVLGQLTIELGDYIYDHVTKPNGIDLSFDNIDDQVEQIIDIAKTQYK